MNTCVNKALEAKTDVFLHSIGVKYTKKEINDVVLKYTITSHKENHKILFIIEEVLDKFHELKERV